MDDLNSAQKEIGDKIARLLAESPLDPEIKNELMDGLDRMPEAVLDCRAGAPTSRLVHPCRAQSVTRFWRRPFQQILAIRGRVVTPFAASRDITGHLAGGSEPL